METRLENEKLINILKELRALNKAGRAYLEDYPYLFQDLVIGNDYTENLYRGQSLLLKHVFGEYTEDVTWFLYEFTPGSSPGPHVVLADGTEYVFNTDEDYYEYLLAQMNGTK